MPDVSAARHGLVLPDRVTVELFTPMLQVVPGGSHQIMLFDLARTRAVTSLNASFYTPVDDVDHTFASEGLSD